MILTSGWVTFFASLCILVGCGMVSWLIYHILDTPEPSHADRIYPHIPETCPFCLEENSRGEKP